ncbi:MAG: transposase [Candidatus Kerfeldbacteria bacterium]|nr:transposase [Candidatus Kerfeldbacteria bacterium]
MRIEELIDGHCYHVFIRGVNRSDIFLNDADRERFSQDLYLFNDQDYYHRGDPLGKEAVLASHPVIGDSRRPFVKILAYCLLTTHFHMILEQCVENGISRFMHKLLMGYAKYFNTRYSRTGPLFERPFRAKPIGTAAHFEHLPRYVHLNALDVLGVPWRGETGVDWGKAWPALLDYPWSSHRFYSGFSQEMNIVDEAAVQEIFPDVLSDYENYIKSWNPMMLSSLHDFLLVTK